MKTLYPDGLDFNLSPTRTEKNNAEQSNLLRHDDLLYMVDELEKKVGVNNSQDVNSLDYRVTRLEERLDLIRSLLVDAGFRAGQKAVTAGVQTVTFNPPTKNAAYEINCYIIDNTGTRIEATPIYDATQLIGSFTVDCSDNGTLHWNLIPHNPMIS